MNNTRRELHTTTSPSYTDRLSFDKYVFVIVDKFIPPFHIFGQYELFVVKIELGGNKY